MEFRRIGRIGRVVTLGGNEKDDNGTDLVGVETNLGW